MLKAVIIDDERIARDFIESILKNNFPGIIISEKASSALEGIKAINQHNPDIVFLDIQLKNDTGFDVLDAIPDKNFELIIITAYDQHAVKAFKYSAIDYIVKPIDVNDFKQAVHKIIDKNPTPESLNTKYNVIKENITSRIPIKIALPIPQGYEYINTPDIIYFMADGRYTHIHIINGNKKTVTKTIGDFNDLIDNKTFYRPHKSFIINLNFVKKLIKRSCTIILEGGIEIPIARNKRDEFIGIISNLHYSE